MGIFGQQVEQTLAVGMAEGFRFGVGVKELDVSGEDHQVVLGNETEVVLDKGQLFFGQSADVLGLPRRVGQDDVVGDDQVHLAIVQGIGGRAEEVHVGLGAQGVVRDVLVLVVVMVARHRVPGNVQQGGALHHGFEYFQLVEGDVAQHDAECELPGAVHQRLDHFPAEVFRVLPVAALRVAEDQNTEILRFVLRIERKIDRGGQLSGGSDARVFHPRGGPFRTVQVVRLGDAVAVGRGGVSSRFDHKEFARSGYRQLVAAFPVGEHHFAAVAHSHTGDSFFRFVEDTVAVVVLIDISFDVFRPSGGQQRRKERQGEKKACFHGRNRCVLIVGTKIRH